MFLALCNPFPTIEDLYEPLMSFASYCSLFALALIVYVKCAEARHKRLAEQRYALSLNNG